MNYDKAMKLKKAPIKRYGLVGYFDILGYQNLLRNNTDDAAIDLVFKLLTEIPPMIVEQQKLAVGGAKEKHLEAIVDELGFNVFSDTVLLTMPLKKNDPDGEHKRFGLFILATIMLQRLMFQNGLPIRGAIAVGDFWLDGSLLAGRPIIAAYDASSVIDAAIVVLDQSADDLYRAKYINPKGNFSIVEYPVPVRGGASRNGLVVNFTVLTDAIYKPLTGDARAIVAKSFSAHNKFIPPEVHQKLTNTEMFLRIMKPPIN